MSNPFDTPLWDQWMLESMSQRDDVVLACYQGRLYYWRVTSSADPWPPMPGPRWSEVQPLPTGTPDCFILARNTNDPAGADSFTVGCAAK